MYVEVHGREKLYRLWGGDSWGWKHEGEKFEV